MLRRYFGLVLLANLAWEVAHLPLYTAWSTETPAFLAFAVAHCTLGDLLIAAAALALSLLVVARERWPAEGYARVAVTATVLGVVYTAFSEWLNLVVRQSWAYSPLMPVIGGIGLTPLLQWLVIPPLAFRFARKANEER